jgi:hypothetical protein
MLSEKSWSWKYSHLYKKENRAKTQPTDKNTDAIKNNTCNIIQLHGIHSGKISATQ